MRRKSGANFDEILGKDWGALNKNEQTELQTAFKKTEQRNGGISFYDLINIIRSSPSLIKISAFLFHRNERIRSTRTYSTNKCEFWILQCWSIQLPFLKNKRIRITEEKFLKKISIVSILSLS
jgi:hypothetical protein